jgi:F-type H+-transporting ATPase subunit b
LLRPRRPAARAEEARTRKSRAAARNGLEAGESTVNINFTLIIQMVVFALLIWFTMKFVWPIILGAMEAREKKIAAGLAAAEKGQQELSQARSNSDSIIREARERAQQIIDQAQHRANEIVDQAKSTATAEGQRLVAAAQTQIDLEANRAREMLRKEVATLAVNTASKLLEREIDARAHADLISKLATQI